MIIFAFNAKQDVAAARVLLGSGVPLVLLPGRGVVDHFSTTGPELEYWLRGKMSSAITSLTRPVMRQRL